MLDRTRGQSRPVVLGQEWDLKAGAWGCLPKDWAKWLTLGVTDADRRRGVAAAARERVLAHPPDRAHRRALGRHLAAARDSRTPRPRGGRLATAAR